MQDEQILITRYDVENTGDEKEARNLLAVVFRHISSKKIKAEFIDGKYRQVKYFNIDDFIEHFEKKINGKDQRFIKSWKRYHQILVKLKEEKLKEKELIKND